MQKKLQLKTIKKLQDARGCRMKGGEIDTDSALIRRRH